MLFLGSSKFVESWASTTQSEKCITISLHKLYLFAAVQKGFFVQIQGAAIVSSSPLLRSYVVEGRKKLLPHPVQCTLRKKVFKRPTFYFINYPNLQQQKGQGTGCHPTFQLGMLFPNGLGTKYVNYDQKMLLESRCGMSQTLTIFVNVTTEI